MWVCKSIRLPKKARIADLIVISLIIYCDKSCDTLILILVILLEPV